MTRAGELADEIARGLGDSTVVREVPTDGSEIAVAVALSDGRVPLLVRDFGHTMSVVLLRTSWDPGTTPVDEIVAATRRWAMESESDRATMLEMALRAADSLGDAFGERWTVRIPGSAVPSEMWLGGADESAAAIAVFRGDSHFR